MSGLRAELERVLGLAEEASVGTREFAMPRVDAEFYAAALAFFKAHGPALLTGQGEDGRDAEYEGYGQACAKARDQWFDSDHGKRCMQGSADGKYLRNRLESAFIAGYSLGHHKGYRDNHAIDAAIQASGSGAG